MIIIGMKELRTNTGEITRRVQAGESFLVMSRSKPVFKVSPVDTEVNESELKTWTSQAIEHFRPALESLADK